MNWPSSRKDPTPAKSVAPNTLHSGAVLAPPPPHSPAKGIGVSRPPHITSPTGHHALHRVW
jgi:hypothetical protein